MEVNKDEAQRCLSIANTHVQSGNLTSALKFVKKSIALYSTPTAVDLLAKITEAQEKETSSPGAGSSSSQSEAKATGAEAHPTASSTSKRHHTSTPASEDTSAPKRQYTQEQVTVVKRVRACKATAYYEILELEKDCDEDGIKKAYRKLALKLHPDKNQAPGADEAFKMVSTAFTILSDPQKRAVYDSNPNVDPTMRGGGGGGFDPSMFAGRPGGFGNGGFQAEMSPEDLFNFIFGGGQGGFGGPAFVSFAFGPGGFQTVNLGGPGRTRRRRQAQAEQEAAQNAQPLTEGQKLVKTLTQLAPLLFFLLFSLLSSFPDMFGTSNPPPRFSFQPSTQFSHERYTANLNVPYYVQPEAFHSHRIWDEVPQDQRRSKDATTKKVKLFEYDVERAYVNMLHNQCAIAEQNRGQQIEQATGFFGIGADWDEVKRLKGETFESCTKLNELRRRGYRPG
ncbi:hypothetical protein M407DRAFT_76444 [Tulasnella calospora MUT 4182]|uniref:J domain-containing protein n=1 Tax=Tulasnella calospora MUT 4182 TaxID=1051891 RepID=A0A0C3LU25_9AGAM|nr:hypothetical protein M407DRAFT_76444 [Tulasnella calospora MUT 4182]